MPFFNLCQLKYQNLFVKFPNSEVFLKNFLSTENILEKNFYGFYHHNDFAQSQRWHFIIPESEEHVLYTRFVNNRE